MTKKLKNIISLILVFIFLTPMTIKLVDGFLHHHEHFICTAKNEKHFHKYHEECPILNFELSFFLAEKLIQTTQKHFYRVELKDNYNFVYCCNNLKYSFLLRAPPEFTGKIVTS